MEIPIGLQIVSLQFMEAVLEGLIEPDHDIEEELFIVDLDRVYEEPGWMKELIENVYGE